MPLKNKVAIVTGGNSGIGQAIVLELARRNASVVIDYVAHPEATEALEQQIAKLGDQSIGVDADVSKLAGLQKLIGEAVRRFGRLDIMVNNAGIETRTSVLDTTEDQYDEVLAVNLKSAFFGTQPSWTCVNCCTAGPYRGQPCIAPSNAESLRRRSGSANEGSPGLYKPGLDLTVSV